MKTPLWLIFAIAAVAALAILAFRPQGSSTIFDEAFEVMDLSSLENCPGYAEQKEIFLTNRDLVSSATADERESVANNWLRFIASGRGERPDSCDWVITPYPAGFITTGARTVIVLNPSDVVVGAPLPEGATGDFVMDATRYAETSLGAFRGAATIPPRSLAVISLR